MHGNREKCVIGMTSIYQECLFNSIKWGKSLTAKTNNHEIWKTSASFHQHEKHRYLWFVQRDGRDRCGCHVSRWGDCLRKLLWQFSITWLFNSRAAPTMEDIIFELFFRLSKFFSGPELLAFLSIQMQRGLWNTKVQGPGGLNIHALLQSAAFYFFFLSI